MALAQVAVQPALRLASQPETRVLQGATQRLLCLAGQPAVLLPVPSRRHFLPVQYHNRGMQQQS